MADWGHFVFGISKYENTVCSISPHLLLGSPPVLPFSDSVNDCAWGLERREQEDWDLARREECHVEGRLEASKLL